MKKAQSIFTLCLFLMFLPTLSSSAYGLEIIGFGDSITQGLQRDSSGNIITNPNPYNGVANLGGYEVELYRLLKTHVGASNVYNWGVGGETTNEGVARIKAILNTRKVNYLLIMEGTNDLFNGISSATTKVNLASIIRQSRAHNVTPILATIPPNTVNTTYASRVKNEYNPKIRQLAGELSAPLADMWTQLNPNWNSLHSGDKLHPNYSGYKKIGQTWFSILSNSIGGRGSSNTSLKIIPILQLLLLD